jgi:hypothetical protein
MLAPQRATAAAGEAAGPAAAAAGDALAGNSGSSSAGRVIARTFEYAVQTPVLPSQLSIAVGQFAVLPYAELLAAAGTAGVSLPPGAPIINVFALKDAASPAAAAAAAADGSTQAAASQQQRGSSAARSSSDGKGGLNPARGSSNAAAAADGASHGLSHERLRLLADTLKPLAVLLRACDKVLNSSLPWGHLQVAVLPEALMLQPWQVGGLAGYNRCLSLQSACPAILFSRQPGCCAVDCYVRPGGGIAA